MIPGQITYPKGATTIVLSYKIATGAIATIITQKFQIVSFKEEHTNWLRLDPSLAFGKIINDQK